MLSLAQRASFGAATDRLLAARGITVDPLLLPIMTGDTGHSEAPSTSAAESPTQPKPQRASWWQQGTSGASQHLTAEPIEQR